MRRILVENAPVELAGGGSGKVIVVGAVDTHSKYVNRVWLQVISNVSCIVLLEFIQENVLPGPTINTDDWGGYSHVKGYGYNHTVTTELIYIHSVFSNLKTWLIGTHHGVSPQHLEAYLNEIPSTASIVVAYLWRHFRQYWDWLKSEWGLPMKGFMVSRKVERIGFIPPIFLRSQPDRHF
jgi:hypothetical protein